MILHAEALEAKTPVGNSLERREVEDTQLLSMVLPELEKNQEGVSP